MAVLQLTRYKRHGIMHTLQLVLGIACLLTRHGCGWIDLLGTVIVTLLVTLNVNLLVTRKVVEVEG